MLLRVRRLRGCSGFRPAWQGRRRWVGCSGERRGSTPAALRPATGPPLQRRPETRPQDARPGAARRLRRPSRSAVPAFQTPWGIAADREGNVFVTDKDQGVVWKMTPTGVITNLAGLTGDAGAGGGLASAARFILPRGIALDQAGNLYVAEAHLLREVTPLGRCQPGSRHRTRGGPGGETSFDLPSGVAVDRGGQCFCGQAVHDSKFTPDGEVSTLAGIEGQAGRQDGSGRRGAV